MKSQTCATRAFTIDLLSGRLTGDHAFRHSNSAVCSRHRIQPQRAAMSAKSLQRRWKHEIQRALLRRRTAMTQFGRILRHGLNGSCPVSLVGPCITGVMSSSGRWGDHDHTDSETDKAIPDDDDIASFPSQASASLQPASGCPLPSWPVCPLGPCLTGPSAWKHLRGHPLETYRRCFPAQPAQQAQ